MRCLDPKALAQWAPPIWTIADLDFNRTLAILGIMLFKRHEEILRCSFCGKTQEQVDTLIANPSEGSGRVYICNECVEVCNSVLDEHRKANAKPATVEARLRASVLEEHERAKAAGASVVARLKAFAARP